MSNEAFEKWFENTVLNDNIHDVTLWAWQAAKADSEQEIAKLKAHINDLREALEKLAGTNGYVKSVALQALASTPAQSLLQHDNEVIEKCAKVCEDINEDGYTTIEEQFCAERIRDLKGK